MKLKTSASNHPSPASRGLIRRGIEDGTSAFCGPEHVVIDLTNRCNNTCIGCWTRSPLLGRQGPGPEWHRYELSFDRLLELIDDLAQMGTKIIRFTGGGEPLLHPYFQQITESVKKKGIYCAVTTNLSPVRDREISRLVSSGLDEIAVSLWASSPEEYVQTHPKQSGEKFAQITHLLKQIKKRKRSNRLFQLRAYERDKPYVNILNVICSLNYLSLEAMYEYARKMGANAVYFTLIDPIEGVTDSLLLDRTQRQMTLRACSTIKEKNSRLKPGRQLFLDNLDNFEMRLQEDAADTGNYDQKSVDAIPCYVGWIFCRILADGRVVPCCRGVQTTMGNINEQPFSSIWHSKRYDSFREKAKKLKKDHPYFRAFDCQKTCDNLMHNLEIHGWLNNDA